jgi:hypothetical protein
MVLPRSDPGANDELSLSALKYLNLCSEEFYLQKKGYLAQDIWNIWETEIKRTLGTPLFVGEWTKLKCEFKSYPEFQSFGEQAQSVSKA